MLGSPSPQMPDILETGVMDDDGEGCGSHFKKYSLNN